MAKWKVAGQMAVAMREAEKQAEENRIKREQLLESIRNGTVLRSLQRGKEQFARKAQVALTSSQQQFPSVQAENVDKTWDAHVAGSAYFQRQDTHNKEVVMVNIQAMDNDLQKMEKIKSAIDIVQIKEREVDRQIGAVRDKMREANMISGLGARVDTVAKRMQVAHQRYGLQLAQNRYLVAQIRHLQDERDKVVKMLNQLKVDLEAFSRQLAVHVEEAQSTYEQRDMNKRNMVKLKDHMLKSSVSYTGDMQLLQFKIDVLKRMELFMITKNKHRCDEGRDRRRERRNQVSFTTRDAITLNGLISKIRSDLSNHDLHAIVRTFTELQQENYMLFRNVSETRDLCHNLKTEIEQVKQMLAQRHDSYTSRERDFMARKVELSQKIDVCKSKAQKAEQQIADANEVIATYVRGVVDIMHKLDYNESDIRRLAGVYANIEERNIRVFMAEMERHVNDLYNLKTLADYLAWLKARWATSQPVDCLPPRYVATRRLLVVPPHFDFQEDTDDPALPTEAAIRPLSWHEMNHYVRQESLSRAHAVDHHAADKGSTNQHHHRPCFLNTTTTDNDANINTANVDVF